MTAVKSFKLCDHVTAVKPFKLWLFVVAMKPFKLSVVVCVTAVKPFKLCLTAMKPLKLYVTDCLTAMKPLKLCVIVCVTAVKLFKLYVIVCLWQLWSPLNSMWLVCLTATKAPPRRCQFPSLWESDPSARSATASPLVSWAAVVSVSIVVTSLLMACLLSWWLVA